MRNHSTPVFILFLLFAHVSVSQRPGEQLFDNSKVHEIRVTSLYDGLPDTLTLNYLLSFGFGQIQTRKVPYTYALITIDGVALDTIGIRYKGFNSWWSSVKKPIKIDLNKYVDQEYDRLSKFNLHNGSGDPSFIRENISYNLLRSLGVKAPRTAFATVSIDDVYQGVFRLVEQIDNTYLDVNFGDHKGNLYVQQSSGSGGFGLDWISDNQEDYYGFLELQNHQSVNDWSALIHFLDVLNHATDANFRTESQAVFDVNAYLKTLAFDVAINNYDWYGNSARNYCLLEVDGKVHWLPWDYNLTWRENAPPVAVNPDDFPLLVRRILSVPEFYHSFLRSYCALLPLLDSEYFDALVENEVSLIAPLMEDDPYQDYPYEAFLANSTMSWDNIPGLTEFASKRYADISSMLESQSIDCSVITGTPEVRDRSFKIYPVPTKDYIHIGSVPLQGAEVTIINNLGQEVLRARLDATGTVDVRNLSPGYYVIKIVVGSSMSSRLIIVE